MKATAKTRVYPRHGMPILGIIDAGYMILAGILLLLIMDFEGLAFLGVGLATLAVCILARFYVLPNYIMLGLAFFNLPLLKIIGAICQAIAGVVFKNVTLTATVTHTPMWGYLAVHSGALLLICAIKWFLTADATDRLRDPLKAVILICAGVVSFDIMAGILGGWLIPWALTKPLAVKIVTIVIYSVVTLLVTAGAVVAAVMIFVKKLRGRPLLLPAQAVEVVVEEEDTFANVKRGVTMADVAWILMIVGTVAQAINTVCISLIWTLPMILHYRKMRANCKDVGVPFKICVLLFVNTIAGILLLVDRKN